MVPPPLSISMFSLTKVASRRLEQDSTFDPCHCGVLLPLCARKDVEDEER